MASSTETVPAPEPEKAVEAPASEPKKAAELPVSDVEKVAPPPEVKGQAATSRPTDYFVLSDVVLRFLLFASAVVAVLVMVTSNETKLVQVPFPPFPTLPFPAKFSHSPALIYLVAALSLAGLYAIITTLLSFYSLLKPGCCPQVISHFVIFDVLLLGIVAAATGAGGAVGYIGLKGNSHVRWGKVCDRYEVFCRHLGGSLAVSLFASIVLTLLVLLSVYSLSKKIPK